MAGSQAAASGNLPIGVVLKRRYRILRKIAQGGMGAVYESTDLAAPQGTRWAVKEMSPASLAPNERTQAIADFRREAQMLAALRHPNLPQVVETFEEMEKYFLVMEFIPGRTLLNVADSTPGFIPQERIMVWARQLFDVLQYLHSQNPPIVYRDLKPANVMLLEGTERIKLIDFGIARFHKTGKSRDTEAFGTAGYAPPEQYGKGQTDQRSDIYALGATLHHVATKHDPSLSPFNWLPARQYNPTLSVQFDTALQRALSLDPSRRFQNVAEFAYALGISLPVPAQPRPASWEAQPVPVTAPKSPGKSKTPAQRPASPAPAKSQPRKKQQPAEAPVYQAPKPVPPPVSGPSIAPATPVPPPVLMPTPSSGLMAAAASVAAASAPTDIRTPSQAPTETFTGQRLASDSPPTQRQTGRPVAPTTVPSLVVSDRLVELGEARWNSKPTRRISVSSVTGRLNGVIMASQPWIAYNPARFQGNPVTIEVKVRQNHLSFGRAELRVPNLFAMIWARARMVLPLLVFWFWLMLLVASSLGKILLWGLAGVIGALLLTEALLWLWALHVRLLVPTPKLNTGRLMVKSSGGDQQIEVRVMARPSWGRKALGWTAAVLLFAAEIGVLVLIALALGGFVSLPGF